MFKIPSIDKKFYQTNESDISGNIWVSKNINFDMRGFLKLSSRVASIFSTEENSDLGYPFSIGRRSLDGTFQLATSGKSFYLSISGTGISATDDGVSADIPVGSLWNRGKWWQNAFHVSTATTLKSRDGVTNVWSSHGGVALTSGYPHAMEVFKNKKTLCIANRNVVKQYDTTYTGTTDLTLPSDYNVVGMAYNNNKMGIATVLDATVSGQGSEALFFVWDGGSTEANAGYGVGSDAILAVVPYKSSWVILTRNGKLLYFNGGGFEELATLPFFFKKYTVGSDSMNGDIMTVSGDLIYLNLPADINYYGLLQERTMQNFVGGILCYDPRVGLYHRYSCSVSKLYDIPVTNVTPATDTFTVNSPTILPATGNPIMQTSDPAVPIGGITFGKIYYIIRIDATHFKLALTKLDAIAGTAIDIPGGGGTSGKFFGLLILDYGASTSVIANAVTLMGNQNYIYDHIIFGGYIYDYDSATPQKVINLTVPGFSNIGYVITPRLESSEVTDQINKFFLKYGTLGTDDKIYVKYKNGDAVGLPVTSGQRGKVCRWVSSTVFTTTADLSAVKTYLDADGENECECEIILGAGAGQMPQISSIEYAAGTYTVTLVDEVEGAVASYYFNVMIDNWKILKTADDEACLTVANTKGWAEFPLPSESNTAKWTKAKLLLYGVDTTIEEFSAPNHTEVPIE